MNKYKIFFSKCNTIEINKRTPSIDKRYRNVIEKKLQTKTKVKTAKKYSNLKI